LANSVESVILLFCVTKRYPALKLGDLVVLTDCSMGHSVRAPFPSISMKDTTF